MMKTMGYKEKFISWIKVCITTPSFTILVNGEATSRFRTSRGIRQGDLLSPLLFVTAMEVSLLF